MPFTWRINIKRNPSPPPRAVFEFEETPQVQVGDLVFWRNDDTVAHWPGVTGNPTFFTGSQIASKSTSSSFAPSQAGTIPYACSIHPDEIGIIVVT